MAAAKKKSTVKKAAVKKAPAKKAVVKKATVKKAVAKKAVAKKTVAKKAVAKKAPVKKVATKKAAVKRAPAKKVVTKRAAVKVSALPEIPEVKFSSTVARPRSVVIEAPLPPVTTQPEIVQEKKSKKRGFIYFLIITLFAAAGFAFNTLSADVEIESSESIVVETPAPTATPIESASPTSEPSQVASTSKANTTAALSATPDFIYTSTGIRFIWKTSGFENFTSVSLNASEGGSEYVVLTTADGSATFIDIAKVDTVSKTTFFLTFTTESSGSVVSEKITIRGKFTK